MLREELGAALLLPRSSTSPTTAAPRNPSVKFKHFCSKTSGFRSPRSPSRLHRWLNPPGRPLPLQTTPPPGTGKGWQRRGDAHSQPRLPTWGVHLYIKYQLGGVGHHHLPPVRVIALHSPHRVVHRGARGCSLARGVGEFKKKNKK